MNRFMRSAITVVMAALLGVTMLSVVAKAAAAATPVQLDLSVLLIGAGPSDPTTAAWQSALSQ